METVLTLVKPLLEMYAGLMPHAVLVALAMIGGFRVVLKPLFSLAYTIVEITPSTKDDEMVKKIDEGKTMKCVRYVLDWIFSLKLPKK